MFINDLDSGVLSGLAKLADDTQIWGSAVTLEDRLAIQADHNRLTRWVDQNLMAFNVKKCKVLYLERENPHRTYRLGSATLASTMSERDLGVMIDHKMNTSHQFDATAGKANKTLACIY